jgi:hypothetical protein
MAPVKRTLVKRGANPSGEGSSVGQASKRTRMPSSVTHGNRQWASDDIIEEEEEQAKQQQQPPEGALVAHAHCDNPRKTL